MTTPKRRGPAPGTILGVIAIVISLSGSAYAIQLSRNSVKSKHIAPNAVKGVDAKESTFAKVPSSAQADNAGTVDGRDAACPPGTFLNGGACFDTNVRLPTSDWTFAAQTCADAGGYLPSPSELTAIRAVAGVDLGTAGNGHWTDSRSEDGGVNESMTALDNGTFESEGVGSLQPVRCAFRLLR